MPALFISHGAPTLAIDNSPTHRFLRGYRKRLGKPAAIVVLSAHFETRIATVTSGRNPETIYDFGGFPPELYEIVYPAPGEPELALEIAALLREAGIPVVMDDARGYDHGAWVPLMLMYADADVPVVQVSINSMRGTDYHYRLGQLLAPLRERGILIIGSGSATHNLAQYFSGSAGSQPADWVTEFNEWLLAHVLAGDVSSLLHYRELAPHAEKNHPSEEHYMPLLCAIGAAGKSDHRERVHRDYEHGVLSMDIYEFGTLTRPPPS